MRIWTLSLRSLIASSVRNSLCPVQLVDFSENGLLSIRNFGVKSVRSGENLRNGPVHKA